MIIPYLRDIINHNKAPIKLKDNSSDKMIDYDQFGESKIQLTMRVNFISSKDSGETRTMRTKSDNIEIMMCSETDEIIKGLYKSFLQRHQKGLEEKMRGSKFVFESVDLLYHSLHKTSLRRGKSYIKSPEWLKNKRAAINPKNYDDNCFQYAITVALNHQNIEIHLERISNIEPFINQYNWEGIDFPSQQIDWKKFEQNNRTIALNILYVPRNTKQIRLACKSKYNCKRNNQVILLIITDGENWHYLAVKNLSRLLRGIT